MKLRNKLIVAGAVALALNSGMLRESEAQEREKWCVSDSQYGYVFSSYVTGLRRSLSAFSIMAEENKIDSSSLVRLTDNSIISLANILSLRTSYLNACDMEQKAYFKKLSDNEIFSLLMFEVTSSDNFPAASQIRRKNLNLVLAPEMAMQDKRIPMHKIVTERLSSVKREASKFPNNPYTIAVDRLLGSSGEKEILEKTIKFIETVPVNPEGLFYDKSTKEIFGIIKTENNTTLVQQLSNYYKTALSHNPTGVPASLFGVK
jgi:hypothetical protein